METRELVSLALYAVGLALAALTWILYLVNIPPSTMIIVLSVAVFALGVAGISSLRQKK